MGYFGWRPGLPWWGSLIGSLRLRGEKGGCPSENVLRTLGVLAVGFFFVSIAEWTGECCIRRMEWAESSHLVLPREVKWKENVTPLSLGERSSDNRDCGNVMGGG